MTQVIILICHSNSVREVLLSWFNRWRNWDQEFSSLTTIIKISTFSDSWWKKSRLNVEWLINDPGYGVTNCQEKICPDYSGIPGLDKAFVTLAKDTSHSITSGPSAQEKPQPYGRVELPLLEVLGSACDQQVQRWKSADRLGSLRDRSPLLQQKDT